MLHSRNSSLVVLSDLSLSFTNPYQHLISLKKNEGEDDNSKNPANEFSFGENKSESGSNEVYFKEYVNIPGAIESSGVLLGDHLVKLNGMDVGVGGPPDRVASNPTLMDVISHLVENPQAFPAILTFARPSKDRSRWESSKFDLDSAETVVVTSNSKEELGCQFGQGSLPNDIIVTSLQDIPGKKL